MPEPERGDVWLVRFPFTELSTAKVRPALVLAVHGEDIIVMGIFSRVPDVAFRETWLLVEETHPERSLTGFRKTSLLKGEKIAVVHESVFQRRLGWLPFDIMQGVTPALKKTLHISP